MYSISPRKLLPTIPTWSNGKQIGQILSLSLTFQISGWEKESKNVSEDSWAQKCVYLSENP